MKKIFLFLLALCAAQTFIHAQERKHCGSTQAEQQVISEHPEYSDRMNYLNEYLNHMDASKLEKKRGNTLVIPIVFHIIHNYGPENISDAQIFDELRILNQDYQKRNPDTSAVVSPFDTIVANCNYEFKLATIDPNGNCTNGIDRIASYKTYYADDQSKLNIWNPTYYFNVWVVNTIGSSGVAGYAYKPATADMIFYYDGVLILHDYIGSIGTGTPFCSRALTHEIGHCFNLDHTWGATNEPGVACGDDNVLDTPPTKGHTQCLLSDDFCNPGTIENVQNYMEYAYCSNMFTRGQKLRMDITLANNVAQRSSLHSALAYQWTGCNNPMPDCPPVGDFTATKQFTCPGNGITFRNQSFKDTVSSVSWNFGADATPSTSTSMTTEFVNFANFGWKSIGITANSNAGSGTTTKTDFVYVADPVGKVVTGQINSFEDPNDYSQWPIFNYANNYFTWKYYDGGSSYNGWRALEYKGFEDRPFPANKTLSANGDMDDIISPAFDLSGLSAGNAYFNFYMAGATRGSSIADMKDTLWVYYSSNCGNSWVKLNNYQNASLCNNGSVSGEFKPDATTTWKPNSIALPSGALTNSTFFKFRIKPGKFANNIYIDNVLIDSKPASVSNSDESGFAFDVIPNPVVNDATLEVNASQSGDAIISIQSIVGDIVYSTKTKIQGGSMNSISLPTSGLKTSGIYFVTLQIGSKKATKKIVIE